MRMTAIPSLRFSAALRITELRKSRLTDQRPPNPHTNCMGEGAPEPQRGWGCGDRINGENGIRKVIRLNT